MGGTRAKLNAAILAADVGKVQGVSLNGSGRVVIGGGAVADITGVICPTEPMAAGDVIDVLRLGDIVEFTTTAGAASTAGTKYYSATSGAISTTNTGKLVGQTVEAGRLVLNVTLA